MLVHCLVRYHLIVLEQVNKLVVLLMLGLNCLLLLACQWLVILFHLASELDNFSDDFGLAHAWSYELLLGLSSYDLLRLVQVLRVYDSAHRWSFDADSTYSGQLEGLALRWHFPLLD